MAARPPTTRKFVAADPDKCVGCGICELICAFEKEQAFNPLKSRIRIVRISDIINLSLTCRLCESPPCVSACPRDALTQAENGLIIIDEDKCDGCGWCVEACDFGAVTIHPEKRVIMVCDLCQERQEKGLRPACIEWCPEEALDLVTADILAQRARVAATRKLFIEAMRTLPI